MALLKSLDTEFGVPATYWHILSADVNRLENSASIVLAGYLDEPARRSGHRPMATLVRTLAHGNTAGIAWSDIYNALKEPGNDPEAAPADLLLTGAMDV